MRYQMRYEMRAPLRLACVHLRYDPGTPLSYQTDAEAVQKYEKDVYLRYESTLWQRGRGGGREGKWKMGILFVGYICHCDYD